MATATAEKNVEAKPRQSGTKNDARRMRKSGLIPAVLYGAGLEPLTIAVDPKQIRRILNSETGHNTIFDLAAGGDSGKAMIVDWQYEPIKGALLHVDLKRIAMDKLLRVSVPIMLKGEAPGVKLQGGILEQMMREVEIECLPADIPGHIDADVSKLEFGQTIRVSDLPHDRQDEVPHRREPGRCPRDRGEGSCGGRSGRGSRSRGDDCRARSHQEGQAGDRRRSCRGEKGEKAEKAEKSEKKK